MTRLNIAGVLTFSTVLAVGADRICAFQTTDKPPYLPPAKAVKLTAEATTALKQAKTAALIAIDVSRVQVVSIDEKKKTVRVAMPGGIRRGVDADKARAELLDGMRDWNRFAIVDDMAQADLVIVVFEDTVEPSRFSKANGDQKHRMRERLAVYAAGRPDTPLWANEVRESTFGAITGSPVGKVVDKFRDELEKRVK